MLSLPYVTVLWSNIVEILFYFFLTNFRIVETFCVLHQVALNSTSISIHLTQLQWLFLKRIQHLAKCDSNSFQNSKDLHFISGNFNQTTSNLIFLKKRVKEENFWLNYFYRVSLIKQSTTLDEINKQNGNFTLF